MFDLRFTIMLLLAIAWVALFVLRRKFIRKDTTRIIDALERIEGKLDAILVIERAKQIVLEYRRLSARDAVHLSVMEQNGIEQILSFDSGFDSFPGIARLP